jgi:uncharacterized membrane protein
MNNDAVYFDFVAWELAKQINLQGWSAWQLFPATGAAGNVAILASLYALFGHTPGLIIPINAAIHALGGVLIFLLAKEISSKESVGTKAGIIAASLFVIFPSSLNWYGQLHKDGYAIAGTLLILLTWVKAVKGCADTRSYLVLLAAHFAGVVLVGIVRPYSLKLLLIASLGVLLFVILDAALRRRLAQEKKLVVYFLVAALTLVGGIGVASSLKSTAVMSTAIKPTLNSIQFGETYANWDFKDAWHWQNTGVLPNLIEDHIELAARTRAGMIEHGLSMHAKSMIDENSRPQNDAAVFAYLPRALQVSIFAPFPSDWLQSKSIIRLVSVAETLICYICFPGVFLLLMYQRHRTLWLSICFAVFFLLICGFIVPNLGSLYRMRYAYQFVMVMLGVLGWITWFDEKSRLKRLTNWISHLDPIREASLTHGKAEAFTFKRIVAPLGAGDSQFHGMSGSRKSGGNH